MTTTGHDRIPIWERVAFLWETGMFGWYPDEWEAWKRSQQGAHDEPSTSPTEGTARMTRMTVRTLTPNGERLAPDALADVPLGTAKVNDVTVGPIVDARVVNGGLAIEYDVEITDPGALTEALAPRREGLPVTAPHSARCVNPHHDPTVSLCSTPLPTFRASGARVYVVESIADVTAPTAAELAAGRDISAAVSLVDGEPD